MQQHILPHRTLLLRIATPTVNVVQLKYLIHLTEKSKSQNLDKSKKEAIQGLSSALISMMDLRFFPRRNMMNFLNGTGPRIMVTRSSNTNKETQIIRSRLNINLSRKLLV